MQGSLKISVVVPTFRRPHDLARCIRALECQLRGPDELIIVVRADDRETLELLDVLSTALPLRRATVHVGGQVAALNRGLDEARGDIVAMTDDDAAPRPDWLRQIEQYYLRDEGLGGVGGRDIVQTGAGQVPLQNAKHVGIVQWFGRRIGNHHIGTGTAREVEMIKGVNMSFRAAAIDGLRFDARLRGVGAQVHNETNFSLAVRRRGWRLIYDPEIVVDHYLGIRHDSDQRNTLNSAALSDAVHNETLALLSYLPVVRRAVFVAWALLVGHRGAPGLAQWVRFAVERDPDAMRRVRASLKGRFAGWRTWRAGEGVNMQ